MSKYISVLKFKLIPFVIIAFAVLLIFKIADIINGTNVVDDIFSIKESIAEQTDNQPVETKETSKDHESASSDAKAQPSNQDINKDTPKIEFSQTELETLQSLAKRREQLDKQNQDLVDKQNLLKAAENRLEKKLEELKILKAEVSKLLDQYNQKEDLKIASLVKIYENMKPKDAAKIFDELDMNIVLQVVAKMKEAKVAPILSQMSPTKAKDLTIQFAEQKKLTPPKE